MMFKRFCLFAILTVVASASSLGSFVQKASAVTAADWQAGRIMDDSVFTGKDSMSAAEVQNFLNQKVGTGRGNPYSVPGVCDTNGTKTSELGGGTRAQYGASHGNPAPFTCLKDYWEVPKTDPGPGVPPSNYGGAAIPAGAKSAAQLIWDAGQRYNISPKVLIIMIQKESAGPLITDDWPFRSQYTYAMGAHCPDSGPGGSANCDQNYAGFSMQIHESARLLRYYLDNMQQPWWSYKKPYQVNHILWNVQQTGCGGANVYINTKATAALYTYTPYQPNQAALNNMYGTGDGCSAYGNRNFWRMYNDWFGSVFAPYFQATFVTHSAYPTILRGNSTEALIRYQNTGTFPWYDDVSAPQYQTYPVRLAKTNPINSGSPFSAFWPSSGRATGPFGRVYEADGVTLASNQHVALPGQIVDFNFSFSVPPNTPAGFYPQYFQPVLEGSNWWNMGGVAWIGVTVQQPQFQATLVGQSEYPTIVRGNSTPAFFRYKNTGNMPWYDDVSAPQYPTYPVRLASTNPIGTESPFSAFWPSRNRATGPFGRVYEADGVTLAANQHTALPGQIVQFDFWFSVPPNTPPGFYRQFFQPILEGSDWWNMGSIAWLGVTVQQ